MECQSIGDLISESRKSQGLTQMELAEKCRINIRSIQRIESNKVIPRMYTLRIINDALGTDFELNTDKAQIDAEEKIFREIYKRRKNIRIVLSVVILTIVLLVLLMAFPSWNLFGLHKRVWAPFLYVIIIIFVAAIAQTWRCPSCKGILGDSFNPKYCSKCGLRFNDES